MVLEDDFGGVVLVVVVVGVVLVEVLLGLLITELFFAM